MPRGRFGERPVRCGRPFAAVATGGKEHLESPDGFIRLLKDSLFPKLLKKVQIQGGARCEVRGVLSAYVAAPRERAGTHRRWVTVDGPFSAAG